MQCCTRGHSAMNARFILDSARCDFDFADSMRDAWLRNDYQPPGVPNMISTGFMSSQNTKTCFHVRGSCHCMLAGKSSQPAAVQYRVLQEMHRAYLLQGAVGLSGLRMPQAVGTYCTQYVVTADCILNHARGRSSISNCHRCTNVDGSVCVK